EVDYLIERLGSNEGSSEGISDIWSDYLMTPQNINKMLFEDMISLPNVSPNDAAAVLYRRARGDTLVDKRDLKNTVGMTYYGYSNLRNYVFYKEPPVKRKLFFDYQFRYRTYSFDQDTEEMYKSVFLRDAYPNPAPHKTDLTLWGYLDLDEYSPDVTHKFRMRYGNDIKMGIMYDKPKGDADFDDSETKDKMWDTKYFAKYDYNFNLFNRNNTIRIVGGNYRATYGEGLTMENTDYFSPRKTGYGFDKRIYGISEDLSRTEVNSLKGLAVEWRNDLFQTSFFASNDKKDAFIYMDQEVDADGNIHSVPAKDANGDYQVFSLVNSTIRFEDDVMEDAETFFNNELDAGAPYSTPYINLAPRKNIVDETLYGGHIQMNPLIGTRLGFTTYTSYYNNAEFIVPDFDELGPVLMRDSYNYQKIKIVDSAITDLYATKTDEYDRDYRQVIGFDGMTLLNNVSLQGEYAEMTKNGEVTKLGDDPSAYLLSSRAQYDNLYLIVLYRDIQAEFDNPYSNAFGEKSKLDGTMLEDSYMLTNPMLTDIVSNNSQTQPEKGYYIETRYRFNNYFTLSKTYLDVFERYSDHRMTYRFDGGLEYRPIFPLRFQIKYTNQTNRFDNDADRQTSTVNRYTATVSASLSARDYFSLEYRYDTVWGPPYVYLFNNADGYGYNESAAGRVFQHGDYICVNYTHNFTEDLKLKGSFLYWDGHGISHWDWEDMEMDFMGAKGNKYWFTVMDRVSNNLFVSLKYKYKQYQSHSYEIRGFYNEPEYIDGQNYYEMVERDEHSIRLQIDWNF
ncbi:MAG: competence protein ComEA, partial [Candidatus Cloacimonetes bacterium]|nr:competence protein ComEA [Candidatus Cloacimonadota bacterium]